MQQQAWLILFFTLALFPLGEASAVDSAKPKADLSREQQREQLLLEYDANGNGKLDKAEVEKLARDRLLRWDKNKDGKLDEKERKALRADSVQMPVKGKPGSTK